MIRRVRLLLVCVLLSLLAACDSGGSSDPDTLTDTWRGTFTRQGTDYTLVLNLQQSQTGGIVESVFGDGRLISGQEEDTLEVMNGTFNEPFLSLSLFFSMGRSASLQGEVSDDFQTIDAELVGGPQSFDGDEVTLNRE